MTGVEDKFHLGKLTKQTEVIDFENSKTSCEDFASFEFSVQSGTGGLLKADKGNYVVLVCGGQGESSSDVLDSCYSFAGNNHGSNSTVRMKTQRKRAASIVIKDGSVLWITGGWGGLDREILSTTEYVTMNPTTSIEGIHIKGY